MENGLDEQYIDLLKDILENGVEKNTRNGKVLSVFGRSIRYKFKDGKFPLLTTKKMPFRLIATELLWFLRGDTNIKYLVENGCNIWNGDAYKNYCRSYKDGHEFYEDTKVKRSFTQEEFINKIKTDDEFAKKWGELGPVYGKQWRDWEYYCGGGDCNVDQIQNLINELKTNPDSRRMVVNAWAVHDLPKMVLPPCHYGFQVYTRELSESERFNWYGNKIGSHMHHDHIVQEMNENNVPTRAISLMFNMRSNDVPLGLPFNIASYGLLLEIFGKMVNMVPDELIANLGDAHIYKNQIDGVKEQLTREPYNLPKLDIYPGILDYELVKLEVDMFKLVNYKSHPSIKMPLSN